MAKKKKQKRSQHQPKRLSTKLHRELMAAKKLVEEGNVSAARSKLVKIGQQNPRSQVALHAVLDLCQEIQDWYTLAYYSEQLLLFERGEERAETLNNLVYAYTQIIHPALAWHYAQELIAAYPDFSEHAQVVSFVKMVEPKMLSEANQLWDTAVYTQDDMLALTVQLDRLRFFTESSHYKEAIQTANALLEQAPGMVPVLNNLSLSQFMMGEIDQAITTAQNVLAQEPDNFHALGNLVRFYFLTAQFDEAKSVALRLQQIAGDYADLEIKQAEAFAFLGYDEQVLAAYERAKTKEPLSSPIFYHLAAVASYRLGNEKRAWSLWQQAVKRFPSFDLAQNSLAEKSLPPGERNLPWYWSFHYWFPQDFKQHLQKQFGKNVDHMSENKAIKGMKSILTERPYLPQLLPHMLERGDRSTREFAINFIRLINSPELAHALFEFVQGRYGSDSIRLEAAKFISQEYPHLLPENKMLPMWINGKQTEIFMLAFEISEEGEGFEGVSEAVLDKFEIVYDLLMNDEPAEAETLIHEIIAEAPHFYSAYNQLAVAYEMQNKSEEAAALVKEIHGRFPDYFFGRVNLARFLVREKKIEEARELIRPLLSLQKLHISEFRALAQAQMDIALAEGKPEAARLWLEMWEQVEPDNPDIFQWQMRLDGPNMLQHLQKMLTKTNKRKSTRRKKR